MTDVQSSFDDRNMRIQKVGVRNVRYPVTVLDRREGSQSTHARVDLFADLPHRFRGTHMSRFIEVFNRYHRDLTMPRFLEMLEEIRISLEAERAYAEIEFPYYMEKAAPVSGQRSMMEYTCHYSGTSTGVHQHFVVGVDVPVTTLCPCSREISDRGAHNQRGVVRTRIELGPFFWFEEIIELVEAAASSGLHTLLKREDEKYVTERAYDHPVFVEDLVREVAVSMEDAHDFPWFSVEAENFESIHNHEAYAYIERSRQEVP